MFTLLLIIAVAVLAVAYMKKGAVEKNTNDEVSQQILNEYEKPQMPEKPKEAVQILDTYFEKKFDEYVRSLYKDEPFLRWETKSDLNANRHRGTVPVTVYFTNGLVDKIKVYCNLEQNSKGPGSFSQSLSFDSNRYEMLKLYKPAGDEDTAPAPAPEPKNEPVQPEAPASPKKGDEENILETAKAWWNEHKDEILSMESIILTKEYLPEELKGKVFKLMQDSGLFASVMCDDDGVYAEAI